MEEYQLLTAQLNRIEQKIDDLNSRAFNRSESLDDWIDETTVRHLTGLGKSTLYKLRQAGKLTSSRFGERKVFYRKSDLKKLLDKNEKAN